MVSTVVSLIADSALHNVPTAPISSAIFLALTSSASKINYSEDPGICAAKILA
jgi:hypothetical protein